MGRLQNNPSIGWVHPKSACVHPLAWGNNKISLLCEYHWKKGLRVKADTKKDLVTFMISLIQYMMIEHSALWIVDFEKNNSMKKINYCWNGKSIITLEMSKTRISNELSTQPYNHTSSYKHHDPPVNCYLLLERARTSHMQMLFSLLYIIYNKQTKTHIYIQIHINFFYSIKH